MPDRSPSAGWPGRVAVGVVRGDPPEVYLADSDATLSRLLALRLVAQTPSEHLRASGHLETIREAMMEERWADAVLSWMEVTGEIVDAYPDELLWTERALDADGASMEIRMAPIFDDPT